MNVQEQIKEWYQDRRFVNYVNMRVQEEIRHVSEQRPDQKYKELDDAFDLDDRYFVPLTTYLTYRLQLAKLQKNRSKTQAWHLVGVCADSHTETLYGNHHQGV